MTTYDDVVHEARRLVKRSEADQWRLAELTWQQVKENNKRQVDWAADVGISQAYVSKLCLIWETFGHIPENKRPRFTEGYAEASGMPADRQRRREMEAVAKITPDGVVEAMRRNPDIARAVARHDDTRDAVEEAAIRHRARHAPPAPDPVEAGRRAAGNISRRLNADLATQELTAAAGRLAEAIVAKEQFGIEHPESEAMALAKIDRYLAAYRGEGTLTDDDRSFLDGLGIRS